LSSAGTAGVNDGCNAGEEHEEMVER
jgi:hypothetical protein